MKIKLLNHSKEINADTSSLTNSSDDELLPCLLKASLQSLQDYNKGQWHSFLKGLMLRHLSHAMRRSPQDDSASATSQRLLHVLLH